MKANSLSNIHGDHFKNVTAMEFPLIRPGDLVFNTK